VPSLATWYQPSDMPPQALQMVMLSPGSMVPQDRHIQVLTATTTDGSTRGTKVSAHAPVPSVASWYQPSDIPQQALQMVMLSSGSSVPQV
jgi:hypothetical protein